MPDPEEIRSSQERTEAQADRVALQQSLATDLLATTNRLLGKIWVLVRVKLVLAVVLLVVAIALQAQVGTRNVRLDRLEKSVDKLEKAATETQDAAEQTRDIAIKVTNQDRAPSPQTQAVFDSITRIEQKVDKILAELPQDQTG